MQKKKLNRKSTLVLLLTILLIMVTLTTSSCHSELSFNDFEKSFVYAITINTLNSVQSVLIPPVIDNIYLLSDVLNVIAPRQTRVYYWALTNRYLADWNTENELINGTLEIFQGKKLVKIIDLQEYVVQYDQKNIAGTLKIYVGEEAVLKYSEFKKAQSQYQQAYFDYYRAKADWHAAMDDIYKKIDSGLTSLEFPEEPIEPANFTVYSTPIAKGFPIILPEGNYIVKFNNSDGTYIKEAQKKLIIFKERQSSVTYSIIPESRWTKPIESNQSGSTIYVAPNANIYISPTYGSEYRDLYYSRMLDPQETSSTRTKWRWVQYLPLANVTMEIADMNNSSNELSLNSYYVRQTGGSSLSYTVIPYDPNTMNQISFNGFSLGNTNKQTNLNINLKDFNGNILPGSERQIRTINPDNAYWLYIISFIPSIFGLIVIISRKKRTEKMKENRTN